MDEKCGNLKVVIDSRELNRNKQKTSDVLQAYINLHSLTNAVDMGISSISKQNTTNKLGKHDFSCN